MSAPLNQYQIPDHSIMDINGRQTYLGNSFILPTAGAALANTVETPLALIKNLGTSSKSLFLFSRKVSSNLNPVTVKFYLNCTPNVLGSTTTALNLRSGATTVSVSVCYLGATITSNGTLLTSLPATTNGDSSDVLYVLDPGGNILVTGTQIGSGTSTVVPVLAWYEI